MPPLYYTLKKISFRPEESRELRVENGIWGWAGFRPGGGGVKCEWQRGNAVQFPGGDRLLANSCRRSLWDDYRIGSAI
jgi:hypothetical protein